MSTEDSSDTLVEGAVVSQGNIVRTNERMREKYYVDENQIMSSVHLTAPATKTALSKVIHGSRVHPNRAPVVLRCSQAAPKGEIQVEVLRKDQAVTGIRINCPCGRHTEVNFKYNSVMP